MVENYRYGVPPQAASGLAGSDPGMQPVLSERMHGSVSVFSAGFRVFRDQRFSLCLSVEFLRPLCSAFLPQNVRMNYIHPRVA
jgi:hypothetical protein